MPLYDGQASYIENGLHTNRMLPLVEKTDFFAPMNLLIGFGVTDLTPETGGEIAINNTQVKNGQTFYTMDTVRPAYIRRWTLTIGFPSANFIYTPLGRLTENLNACVRDYFMAYLCPEEPCKAFFWQLEDVRLAPLTPTDGPITINDDGAQINATAAATSQRVRIHKNIRKNLAQDAGVTLYTVNLCSANCEGCDEPNSVGLYAGFDSSNTGTPIAEYTTDQFASGTDITPLVAAIPAANSVLGSYCQDDLIILAHSDDADLAAATDGGLAVSKDGGTSYTSAIDTGTGSALAVAMADVWSGGGYYWACGAAGAIYRSTDALNWTALNTSAVAATTDFYRGAWDTDSQIGYAVGYDPSGTAGIAVQIVGGAVGDITSVVGAGTAGIYSVAVLAPNHIIMGGDAGAIWEHPNASRASAGNPFTAAITNFGATATDIVKFVGGTPRRTVAACGKQIRERSVLTDLEWALVQELPGTTPSGDFSNGAAGQMTGDHHPGMNFFVLITDAGEIFRLQPCYQFVI